jgi:dihydropyrimidinase
MECETVIRGGRVARADSVVEADVGIAGGMIVAVDQGLPPAPTEIDARGMLVAPGGVDVHVHFGVHIDAVGGSMADDYESGTRAAAAGGVTTVLSFAFQKSGQPLRDAVEEELSSALGRAHVDYGVHLGVTDLSVSGTLDDVKTLANEGFPSVKIFTAV